MTCGRGQADYERIGVGYSLHRRPDPRIARAIHAALGDATISRIADVPARLVQLERDLDCGAWDARNAELHGLAELDIGYRVVVADT
ncbi:MAG TPA: hypothetical protein VHM19_12725 [Polyangiales bacterium]|nr:hypothetical protein [Polyangiales bacterium]